jgi:hypothetical protein
MELQRFDCKDKSANHGCDLKGQFSAIEKEIQEVVSGYWKPFNFDSCFLGVVSYFLCYFCSVIVRDVFYTINTTKINSFWTQKGKRIPPMTA